MTAATLPPRPHTTVILAMSADGKIADARRSPPQFGSAADYAHLERQVAAADGVLFGATTLRAGGTAMRVREPELLQQRQQRGLPAQPIQIVCSRTGKLDLQLPFFRQPVPRWLLTTPTGAVAWQHRPEFSTILAFAEHSDWHLALAEMANQGIRQLAVLGGGELIATLLSLQLIDELWLTVCPLLLGGTAAPTPVGGAGFLAAEAPRLKLLAVEPVADELFLHYQVQRLDANG